MCCRQCVHVWSAYSSVPGVTSGADVGQHSSQQTLHTIIGLPHLEDASDQVHTDPHTGSSAEHSDSIAAVQSSASFDPGTGSPSRTCPTAEDSNSITIVQSAASFDGTSDGDMTVSYTIWVHYSIHCPGAFTDFGFVLLFIHGSLFHILILMDITELQQVQPHTLLRFAKASKRFM